MIDRDAVIWLHRAGGFGLAGTALDAAVQRGPAAELDLLLDADGAGAVPPDLWDDALLARDPMDADARVHAVSGWLAGLAVAEQPLVERLGWLWHGHLVSALDKVRVARLMVDQVRLMRRHALGNFAELLRDITIDPAMMVYLDLRTSTGEEPNENYARELMELFALGEGNYTEADVKAAAAALTGWTMRPGRGVRFEPSLHDDTPRTLLGVPGVHDLDTVLEAVTGHPALPEFVAGAVSMELLGTAATAVVAAPAAAFAASGLDLRVLVRTVLDEGLAGRAESYVLAPVPWLVQAVRVCAAPLPSNVATRVARLLRDAGQLPMLPPSVAGWPGGVAWFGAGALVARANLAALVARAATNAAVIEASSADDPPALAAALGLPSSGFAAGTADALASAPPGPDRLAVALFSPEFMIVEAPR